LARRYAQGGLAVALTGRTRERLEAIAAEVHAAGGVAHVVAGDVADEAQIDALSREVAGLGDLHAAVFNAAGAARAPSLELTVEQFEQAWRVSTLGGFVFGRAALRLLLNNAGSSAGPSGRGSLIFTGATASLRGRPPFTAFASAKAGLRSLSQSLAREFGPQGIHVAHAVIDGGIDGERLRSSAAQRVAEAGPDGLLAPDAIAEAYWQLHLQQRSAWSQEIDLRPWSERY
jgi:NAD(P)-dependent dehydrogenase (short-subunit alcohol dehydrogenase family)